MTLTGLEIFHLAQLAGFDIRKCRADEEEDLHEAEYQIIPCPTDGLRDESPTCSKRYHYRLIAFNSEYPEEGASGLGPELEPHAEGE